jgi:hypothetical protein
MVVSDANCVLSTQAIGSGAITGSGGTGQVAFFNGTSTITSENNLFWDSTNDRLGINISNPQDKLDVIGEVLFGSQTERLSAGSSSLAWNRRVATGQIYDSSRFAYQFQHTGSTTAINDYLALQVYNTAGSGVTSTALVVNGAANVLIGTATDTSDKLRVAGNTFTNTIRTYTPDLETRSVAWKLGTARGGTVTTNATVRVEIDGVLVDLVARYV